MNQRLHLLSPKGFATGAFHAGIKSRQTPDVGLLICETTASAAAVFTRMEHMEEAMKR
jgi:N-acetylglutamate synthase/N-acetylornithine aminotransferase